MKKNLLLLILKDIKKIKMILMELNSKNNIVIWVSILMKKDLLNLIYKELKIDVIT